MTFRFITLGSVMLALLAGCSSGDGTAELKEGMAAYELQDYVKATKKFEQCLQLAPRNVDALVALARLKLKVGQLEDARRSVDRALALDAKAVDVRLLAAQLAFHAKDYPQAMKFYSELAEDAKLDNEIRSQAWTGVGIVEVMLERLHAARVAYLKAIKYNFNNASAQYHLGRLYRDGFGFMEAALERFEIYVRIDKVADVRVQKVQRSVIPELKQVINNALTQFPGVDKRDSSAAAQRIAQAEAAVKKGNYKMAKAEYEAALKLDPISYPAALGLAKTLERTDVKAALGKYQLACRLNSSAISTFIHTGALAARLGMNGIAEHVYSRALAASPKSTAALDGLIRVLRVNKQPKAAQLYQSYRDLLTVVKRK